MVSIPKKSALCLIHSLPYDAILLILALPMQVSIISVDSFHQQMNRGAVAEVTLMSDSTKVIHSFLQEFYLVYLFIYYLLLVARHQQPYDVDHVCT